MRYKKGDIIFISYHSGMADLYCHIQTHVEGKIRFDVINGLWDGIFDVEQRSIYVCHTRERCPAKIVYDLQDIRMSDYNEAIETANNRLEANGGPCLRTGESSKSGCAHGESVRAVPVRSSTSNSSNASSCKGSKLSRHILWGKKYLIIDRVHKEIRIFEKQGSKNILIKNLGECET